MKSLLYRLLPYFVLFIVAEAVIRLVLGIVEWNNLDYGALSLTKSMLAGLIPDIAAFLYILPLLILLQFCIPHRITHTQSEKIIQGVFYAIFFSVILFTNVSQWFFWQELTSRFNFIAVDYLVYMDEVTGNIMESYPVIPILSILVIVAAMGGYLYTTCLASHLSSSFTLSNKLIIVAVSVLLAGTSFFLVSEDSNRFSENHFENEIAKNGVFSLFSAFRNNELSYKAFYRTQSNRKALNTLRDHLSSDGYPFVNQDDITRRITPKGKEIHPNIVIITVESLSAEYMGIFGNDKHLTPYLDALSKESLFFDNLYAIGTRTVYGLTAVTLSIPPIPGNAIARRPNNDHLFSLGSVLNSKGYDSRFIYGGYGYFDNMNAFFAGNGYQIVDRSNLSKDEITFANIWGVCDEDVFNRTLKENDASYAQGKPFFDMIMTTSNHQPFTYPDGKIDIPSGNGRYGAVKYTDYAIGQFIESARKHPWFDNTIFVIVADHTAGSSGKLVLTPDRHHIPMLFYAPKLIKPQTINMMASQIDLAPTLLGVMNASYESRFYGHNLLQSSVERAFIANYQHVGLLKPDSLTVLAPMHGVISYEKINGEFKRTDTTPTHLLNEAIAYFQTASRWHKLNQSITVPLKNTKAEKATKE